MRHVVFAVPYAMDATLRFVRAAAELPNVRLGILSQEPPERLPPEVLSRIAAHQQVKSCLDGDQVSGGVRALGRRFGAPVDRLIGILEPMQEALDHYAAHFQLSWTQMMSDKLGIANIGDEPFRNFVERCPEILQIVETDMTLFFRNLAKVSPDTSLSDEQLVEPLEEAYYAGEIPGPEQRKKTADWLRELIQRWKASAVSDELRVKSMNASNPQYVLRNYLAQLAIDKAEEGDYSLIHDLQSVLETPYEKQVGKEEYAKKRPEWARNRAGCSMLSCSS